MPRSRHIAHGSPALRKLALVMLAELELPERTSLAVDISDDHGCTRSAAGLPASSRVLTAPKLHLLTMRFCHFVVS